MPGVVFYINMYVATSEIAMPNSRLDKVVTHVEGVDTGRLAECPCEARLTRKNPLPIAQTCFAHGDRSAQPTLPSNDAMKRILSNQDTKFEELGPLGREKQ